MGKIFKKRYIALAGLVLVLGLAVYLNWRFNVEDKELQATRVLAEDQAMEDAAKNYGDAAFVNASSDSIVPSSSTANTTSGSTSEYFAQARLTRQQTRDDAISVIRETLNDVKVSEDVKSAAALEIANIAKQIENEGKIENLIKAKGFEECMVYLDGENADVVVKSPEALISSQVIQIKDIVQSQADISGEIKIVEVK